MNIDLDRILEAGVKVMDSAVKTASDIARQGKKQADLLAAQNKLAKAQRQLGMLVYDLAKNGEENPLLVKKYIASIASIEAEIEDLKAAPAAEPSARPQAEPQQEPQPAQTATYVYEVPVEEEEETQKTCPQCGAEVEEDAVFCSGCGAQL